MGVETNWKAFYSFGGITWTSLEYLKWSDLSKLHTQILENLNASDPYWKDSPRIIEMYEIVKADIAIEEKKYKKEASSLRTPLFPFEIMLIVDGFDIEYGKLNAHYRSGRKYKKGSTQVRIILDNNCEWSFMLRVNGKSSFHPLYNEVDKYQDAITGKLPTQPQTAMIIG